MEPHRPISFPRGAFGRLHRFRAGWSAAGFVVLAGAGLGLAGCTASAGAPSIALFGAYFPAWLACALAGILGAVIVRLVFISLGIDDLLPARLPVYVAVAAAIGFLVSLVGFGR